MTFDYTSFSQECMNFKAQVQNKHENNRIPGNQPTYVRDYTAGKFPQQAMRTFNVFIIGSYSNISLPY